MKVINLYSTLERDMGVYDALAGIVDGSGQEALAVVRIDEELTIDSVYVQVPLPSGFAVYIDTHHPVFNEHTNNYEWIIKAYDESFGFAARLIRMYPQDGGYEVFVSDQVNVSFNGGLVLDAAEQQYYMFHGGELRRYDIDLTNETIIPINLKPTPTTTVGSFFYIEEIGPDSITFLHNERGPEFSSDLYEQEGYVWRYKFPKEGSTDLIPTSTDSVHIYMVEHVRLFDRPGDLDASFWYHGLSLQAIERTTAILDSPVLSTQFTTDRRPNEALSDIAIVDSKYLMVVGLYHNSFEIFYYFLDLQDPLFAEVERVEIAAPSGVIYPNPARDQLFTPWLLHKYQISDLAGRVVVEGITDDTGVIDVSWLDVGSYIVRSHYDGNLVIRQFVKI